MASPATPAAMQRLRTLLAGVWRGKGSVLPASHPEARPPLGAQPVPYLEEVRFWPLGPGKPVLGYSQRTRHAENGNPLHTETGFWRLLDSGKAEVALAQPFAVAEVSEGVVEVLVNEEEKVEAAADDAGAEAGSPSLSSSSSSFKISIRTTGIARSSGNKPPAVRELVRTFWLSADGQQLRYRVDMATERIPVAELHLEASLQRAPEQDQE